MSKTIVDNLKIVTEPTTVTGNTKVLVRNLTTGDVELQENSVGEFVPLSGTEAGISITGDLEFDTNLGIKRLYTTNIKANSSAVLDAGSFITESYMNNSSGYSAISINAEGSVNIYTQVDGLPSKGLSSIFDYTANIGELDYPQEKYVIPITGTRAGNPVTGSIEIKYDDISFLPVSIFQNDTPNDKKFLLKFDPDLSQMTLGMQKISDATDYIEIRISTTGGIEIANNTFGVYVNLDKITPKGLTGSSDYSANITDLDFTQKIYVDLNKLTEYTVATLPAGVLGQTAFVNDALAPTYLTVIVGGGAVKCPVFFNGTNWVAH